MTKRLLALALALIMLISLAACAKKSAEPEEAPGSTPLLYKVTDSQGHVVWLFGSIHVATEDMYPLPNYVMDAYKEADALAVECDVIAAEEDLSGMIDLVQSMMYSDGTTIADHISPETYEAAVDILRENNYYFPALDYYTPMFWATFIETFLYTNLGFDSEIGIDMTLLTKAKEEGKPILEIESVEFQYSMLADFSSELQELMLESSIETYSNPLAKVSFNTLVNAWKEGDEAVLSVMLNSDSSGLEESEQALMEEYNQAMITDRNISMADFAEEQLASGEKVFICVGAAHIVGDGGMADLLQQRGYTVEKVN